MSLKKNKDQIFAKRIGGTVRRLDVYSFLFFLAMNVFATELFTRVYGSFLLLVLLDSAATLFSINLLVSLDRSAFAFTFVVLSAAFLSFNIIYLVLEIIVLVALLDFSFLLRKLSDTKFERAILNRRLAFYGETLVPSFFLSYAVIYLYSFIPNSQSFAAPVFAISSVGAIFIILVMVRSLSSPSLLGRKQSSETGN